PSAHAASWDSGTHALSLTPSVIPTFGIARTIGCAARVEPLPAWPERKTHPMSSRVAPSFTTRHLTDDDARAAASATLVDLLNFRVQNSPERVVYRFLP